MHSTYSKCGLIVLLFSFLSSLMVVAQENSCDCDFAECNNLVPNGDIEHLMPFTTIAGIEIVSSARCWNVWKNSPHIFDVGQSEIWAEPGFSLQESYTGLSDNNIGICLASQEGIWADFLEPLNSNGGVYTMSFWAFAASNANPGFNPTIEIGINSSTAIPADWSSPNLLSLEEYSVPATLGVWIYHTVEFVVPVGLDFQSLYMQNTTSFSNTSVVFIDGIKVTPQEIQPILPLAISQGSQAICQGNDLNINVLSEIDCPLSWTIDGNVFSTSSSVVVNPTETTTYTVDTTDPCYTQSQITIEVLAVTPFELVVSSNEICEGQGVVLTCSDQNLIYDWSPGIVAFPDWNYLKVATFVESTNVVVSANEDNGCSFQQEVYITVNPNPVFTLSANSTNLCPQESVVIQASDASLNYTWTGSEIISEAGNTIAVSPAQTSDYTAIATNGQCTDIETIQISVSPNLIITGDVLNSIDDLCNGQITVSTNYSGSPSDLEFLWLYNGNPTGGNSQTITGLCPGNYICMCTTANGCTGYLNVTIFSISAPEIDAIVQNDACLSTQGSGSISLSSMLDFTIQWAGPNGFSSSSNTISGLSAGNYVASFYFEGFPMFQQSYSISAMAGTNLGFIDASENLNGQILVVSGNITVENGVIWEVNNSTLFMQGNGRIIIEAGGKIIAKTSTFTSGCSTFWSGIEVRALNNNPLYESQGKLEITDNCIIEHALIGVRAGQAVNSSLNSTIQNTGGGKIFAQNSTFRNNRRDVLFSQYPWAYGPSFLGSSLNKPVVFNQCLFLISEINSNPIYSHLDKVSMTGAKNVWFKDCDFVNELPQVLETNPQGGTPTINALYTLFGYTNIHDCRFNGFPRGIWLRSGSSLLSQVVGCTFKCYRGILVQDCSNIKIQSNSFYPIQVHFDSDGNAFPEVSNFYTDNTEDEDFSDDEYYVDYINNIQGNTWKSSYGVYIENPIMLSLNNNLFNLYGPENVLRVGAYVVGNDANNNDIKSNAFRGCTVGMRFYNDNRGGTPNQGLQFSCNSFGENISDVEINAHPSVFSSADASMGVRFNLGNPFMSRANQFDEDVYLNLSENFYSHDEMHHNYFYFENSDGNAEILPNECSPSVTTILVMDYTTGCSIPQFYNESDFNIDINNYQDTKEIYNSIVDGGNKPQTIDDILGVTFADALELYYSLMAKSPALSEDAMIELIKKETEIPDLLLTAILASNPTAAKSTIVQKALNQKEFPLSMYQRQMIDQGRFVLSLKENLEIEMSDKQSLLNEYTLLFAESLLTNEDLTESWENQFEDFLLARADFSSGVALIDMYLDQARFNEAFVMSNSLLSVLSPKTSEYNDMVSVQGLIPLAEILFADSTGGATALRREELESYISYEHPIASRIVGKLLSKIEDYHREEELNYTFMKLASRSSKNSSTPVVNPSLIAPNPASDFAILTLPKKYLGLSYTMSIFDIAGQVQRRIETNSGQEQIIIELQDLTSGIYLVQINFENGDSLEEKLIKH